MQRQLRMRFTRRFLCYRKVSRTERSKEMVKRKRSKVRPRLLRPICSARPLLHQIRAHMEVSLYLVGRPRTVSLPWIINCSDPRKSSSQKICMGWSGGFGISTGKTRICGFFTGTFCFEPYQKKACCLGIQFRGFKGNLSWDLVSHGDICSRPDGVLLSIRKSSFQGMPFSSLGVYTNVGANGELRLGVRRAANIKSGITYPVLCRQRSNVATLAAVANALSTKSMFHIYYNPRESPSEFIIPYRKFVKSFDHSFPIGMRFKMLFDNEDAADRRYTGLITGIGDIDPVRWPGSKWKCLLVRWDDVETNRQDRVSPWEIEPSGSIPSSSNLIVPGSKRTKISPPSVKEDFPLPNGSGLSGFMESYGFHKVLQGQEISGFGTPYDGIDVLNHQSSERRGCIPNPNSSRIVGIQNGVRIPLPGNSDTSSLKGTSLGESVRFHKVLQGQEIFPLKPQHSGIQVDAWAHQNGGLGFFEGFHLSSSGRRWPTLLQGYRAHVLPSVPSRKVSSPSSVLTFPQASIHTAYGIDNQKRREKGRYFITHGSPPCGSPCDPEHSGEDLGSMYSLYHPSKEYNILGAVHTPVLVGKVDRSNGQGGIPSKSCCRLFGFPLTKETVVATEADSVPVDSPSSMKDLNMEATFHPTTEGQLLSKSHGLTKIAGRNCTIAREFISRSMMGAMI
ncbi:auxin response factor 2-like isoform X6 [Magnolia sinica]|uniref:auxin response factor 2-like isoform X6 n=1 Tax=Magnolia sinica TaxID=86752 RepID=UPI0026586A6F|nr:auxin response factor 2-like isoform X6 [Magnolia sinica]